MVYLLTWRQPRNGWSHRRVQSHIGRVWFWKVSGVDSLPSGRRCRSLACLASHGILSQAVAGSRQTSSRLANAGCPRPWPGTGCLGCRWAGSARQAGRLGRDLAYIWYMGCCMGWWGRICRSESLCVRGEWSVTIYWLAVNCVRYWTIQKES